MNISIKKGVFSKFNPKLKIVFILAENVDNVTKVKEAKHLLKEVENLISLTFHKDNVKNHNLISPWKVAQEAFGKEARHYNTSVERLIKKIMKRSGM